MERRKRFWVFAVVPVPVSRSGFEIWSFHLGFVMQVFLKVSFPFSFILFIFYFSVII
jgi:hypothetical protein